MISIGFYFIWLSVHMIFLALVLAGPQKFRMNKLET